VGGSDAAISRVEDILGQLDWLTAELEAQRPLLSRIPGVQLTAQPLADQPSLIGFYLDMLSRERDRLVMLSVAWNDRECDAEDMDCVLQALIAARSALLETLRSRASDDWHENVPGDEQQSLLDWAFKITLDDGDALRKVAERLHESQLSLGGKRPDGP
jgi:hypothetical protein